MSACEIDHAKIGVVWAAHDLTADCVYVYDALIRPRCDLAILAATLKDKGRSDSGIEKPWIPVLFDHKRVDEEDGIRIAERLAELGVEIYTASSNREAAATEMGIRLSTGRLKVFSHLEPWFQEYERYRRDDKGEMIETDTHLMGATGLLISHLSFAIAENKASSDAEGFDMQDWSRRQAAPITGY